MESIFISHSSKDKYIIDQFVEKILLLGCGINDKQIFCTSIEGLGIKNGNDFREHIKNSLIQATYSFIMISNNYRESEVCINEMGASWALSNLKVKQFLFPKLSFNSLGLLLNIKQAAIINKESDLDELYDELTSYYKIEKNIVRWNKHKNDFIRIANIEILNQKNNTTHNSKDFFQEFLKKNVSLNHLLLNSHPTILDCKVIFAKEYYQTFFKQYCNQFEHLEKEAFAPLFPKYTSIKISKNNTEDLINGKSQLAGGMAKIAKKGYFNSGIDFYRVTFLENENSVAGLSYNVFCYVNNRWVFIPKPWRYEK